MTLKLRGPFQSLSILHWSPLLMVRNSGENYDFDSFRIVLKRTFDFIRGHFGFVCNKTINVLIMAIVLILHLAM